jgi:hypothetical protein
MVVADRDQAGRVDLLDALGDQQTQVLLFLEERGILGKLGSEDEAVGFIEGQKGRFGFSFVPSRQGILICIQRRFQKLGRVLLFA